MVLIKFSIDAADYPTFGLAVWTSFRTTFVLLIKRLNDLCKQEYDISQIDRCIVDSGSVRLDQYCRQKWQLWCRDKTTFKRSESVVASCETQTLSENTWNKHCFDPGR